MEGPTLSPVTLRGEHALLEPLRQDHLDALAPAADEPDLWTHMGMMAHQRHDLARWIELRLRDVDAGTAIAFLIRDSKTRQAVGSTSLFDYARTHRRIEIGHTWIGRTHRGTSVNPDAKLLLFGHAFDTLRLTRVQLKCDPHNLRSAAAMRKIGATEEGILRNYITYADGTVHDRLFFSVIDRDWPRVKRHLQDLVARNPRQP